MDLAILAAAAVFLAILLNWAFRNLPREEWQIAATIPLRDRIGDGSWRGQNITLYGVFSATAYFIAVGIIFMLVGAVGVPWYAPIVLTLLIMPVVIPASKLISWAVERNPHGFTVGGAAFLGILMSPAAVWATNWLLAGSGTELPAAPAMAALCIAYLFGEGLGRLACISFGCCYGKPLSDCGAFVQRLFARHHFVFRGECKKASFASGLDGVPVVPIQAITVLVYSVSGLVCIWLYLQSEFLTAFVVAAVIAQGWRVYSETLRADYRGGARVSAYQWMAAAGILITFVWAYVLPNSAGVQASLVAGIQSLWNPAILLFLQSIWIALLLFMGLSAQTTANVKFDVVRDRI